MPLGDLARAFSLLTRLPLVHSVPMPHDLARCVWAFPVVGLAVNGLGGLVYWLAHHASLSPVVSAAWAFAAMAVGTGALHEDGLADTADGFGGGASAPRKLEIMRDSRIGCYGALALMLSVIIRVGSIAGLDEPRRVVPVLIVAGVLGRGGILVLLSLLRPVRAEGMGASLGEVSPIGLAVGLALAVVAALLVAPMRMAPFAVALAAGVALGVAWLAHRQIRGYTGDVLGAAEVGVECAVLTLAASTFGA